MAILEYTVVQPPTSAELEAQALNALGAEDLAVKGLVHIVVKSVQQVPAPHEETMLLRIRRQEYGADGHLTSILGNASIGNADAAYDTDSAVVRLARDKSSPATAHVVKV